MKICWLWLLLTAAQVTGNDVIGSQPAQGAASLAFVFDVTGSMYDDLLQVIEGASRILATTLSRREQPLHNYVLVPFRDPEIGPVTVTTDADEFEDKLSYLYVQGGGDCPEVSIGAIQEALEVSLPRSYIYVFTDARAKDYHLTDKVIELIQRKESQVVFVMTGDCGDNTHEGFLSYLKIASTSSGQVFLLKKHQVDEVLNFVKIAINTRKVNLLSIDHERPSKTIYTLPVDSHLREFTVSLSGEEPFISITDQDGNPPPRDQFTELLRLRNVYIVNVKDPKPGNWTFDVSSSSAHTLRVTGISTLDFTQRFGVGDVIDFSTAYARPVAGLPMMSYINGTGVVDGVTFHQVDFMSLDGRTLHSLPLQYTDHTNLYNTSFILPPAGFFYVQVTGTDEEGFTFIRSSKSAISAVVPASPVVTIASRVLGQHGSSLNMLCIVDSLVPFVVTWYRGDKSISEDKHFLQTETVIHTLHNLTLADEGNYSCVATSDAGRAQGVLRLEVSDPPPYIHPTLNVTVAPEAKAILDCVVESDVDYTVRWYRVSPHSGRYITLPKPMFLPNNSLSIPRVEENGEGWYVCEAENSGGATSQRTFLKVGEAPVARVRPRDVDFVAGGEMRLRCTATGSQPVSIGWKRRGYTLAVSGGRVEIKENELLMRDMTQSDAGIYECVATNIAGVSTAAAVVRYMERPYIRLEKDSMLVAKGDSAALVCEATGIPAPEIIWFKNGKEINERNAFVRVTSSGELMLLGAQPEDAADYTCLAQNDAGADQAVIRLEVGSVPVITDPPRSIQIDIGLNFSMPCVASGYPQPSISWSKENEYLDGVRTVVSVNNSLSITEVAKEDEGTYTCSATNQFGSHDASAVVVVTGIVAPVIAFMSPLVELKQGDTFFLKCMVVVGNPKPSIQWYKGGEIISPVAGKTLISLEGSLTVTDVEVADEGEYMCKASNIGGMAMMHTRLDVRVPPVIEGSDTIERVNTLQGTAVNLSCVYSGDPEPEIMWTKNGNPISLTDQHYFVNEDNSLEIFVTNPDDTAQYACTARNPVGDDTKTITLTIQVKPKIIRGDGTDKEVVKVGDQLIIPCEVTAHPPPTIVWTHNGVVVDVVKPGYTQLDSGAYKITKVVSADSGVWMCIATNVVGNTTKSVKVKVNVPPEITDFGPTEYTVITGDPVTLKCQAAGTPMPTVQWRKNGNFLTSEDFADGLTIMADGSLRLSSAQIVDQGLYACVATNDAGRATKSIKLIVHEPPTWPTDYKPTDISVVQGYPTKMLCPAQGFPKPEIVWYKDGVELTGNELGITVNVDGSLDIAIAQVSDSGRYSCKAVNEAGDVSLDIEFSVYVPPMITDGPLDWPTDGGVTTIVNATLTLHCPAEAIPPPVITWYRDGSELVLDTDRMQLEQEGQLLIINDAQLSDKGRYKCVAENVAGETEKVTDVDIYEPPRIEDHPSSSKENITTVSGRNLFIECSAQGKPLPEITWFKNNQPLKSSDAVLILDGGRRLHLTNPEPGNEGMYTCVAANAAGTARKSYRVNVYVPPEISNSGEVSTHEVVRGRNIKLRCPATGNPPPTITWTRSGEVVDPDLYPISDNGSILTIPLADLADRGRYVCIAENEAGENEKTFDLSVLVPPTIDLSATTTNVSVVENQTAILTCAADGDPYPEILWLFENELLDSSSRPLTEITARGRQLKLHNVQLSDEAVYTCLATNKAGDKQVDVTLNVLIPPTISPVDLKLNTSVVRGLRTAVECPAEGKPTPKIKWYKDGVEMDIAANPYYGLVNAGRRLIIANASLDDTAVYTCRASNVAGRSELRHHLTVYDPPTIKDSELVTPLEVLINDSITIDCNAAGIPRPTVEWLSNGQPLPVNSQHWRVSRGGYSLTLLRADLSHTARYTCIATNDAGTADKDFDLDVFVPPYIDDTNIERNIRIIKGRQLTLNCPASGTPRPDIKWYRNGFPVEDLTRGDDLSAISLLYSNRQLTIYSIAVDDTGSYTCQARNIAGQSSLKFNVFVLVSPSIDDSNIVNRPRVRQNQTVIIECPARGIPDPTVVFLKNGRPIEELSHVVVDAKRFVIDSAQVTDSGRYTCIARNEAGEARRTYDLQVQVPARINRDGLEMDLSVVENRTELISCPVTGIPQPSIIWFRGREPLIDGPYPNIRLLNDDQQLELSNVQLSAAGTYSCKATNAAGRDRQEFHLQVYLPPGFDEEQAPSTEQFVSVVKKAFSLSCPVEGEPQPVVHWYKDGVLISRENLQYRISFDGQLLDIISVQVEDAGKFTCEAVNPAGKVTRDFSLTVYVPTTITGSDEITDVSVIVGEPTTLECSVGGIPPPRISWFKDGELLDPRESSNIRIINSGQQMMIVDAQLLDVGGYMCIATNAAGNDSKPFQVNVQVPPSIERSDQFVAATDKTRTLLLCETYGLPTPNIVWYKDGVELNPQANPRYRMLQSGSLEFSAVNPTDTGNYTCVASNVAGSSNKSLTLSIQVIPQHINPYQEVSVISGGDISLKCDVTGTPTPRVIWQIGTRIVANYPPEQLDKSLAIEGARSTDSATYLCIAQNPAGTSTGRVKLMVLVKPTIDSDRELYRVISGRELQIPCLSQGVPRPTITWSKDGVDIAADDYRYSLLLNGRLSISITTSEDEGVYTCEAVNEAGFAEHSVKVNVLVPANIGSYEKSVTAVQGSDVELICRVEGVPPPTITWQRDFTLLESGHKYNMEEDGTLVIHEVTANDGTTYVCMATNEAGQDSAKTALRVQVPPKIIVAPDGVEVNEGDDIYMQCVATGTPLPSLVWKLNGTLIASATSVGGSSNLEVKDARVSDTGTYMCVAENAAGSAQRIATARVNVPPRLVVAPGNTAVRVSNQVLLECSVQGSPTPQIMWTKDGSPVVQSNRIQQLANGSLVIKDTIREDGGEYKCVASNEAGTSEGLAQLFVRTPPSFSIEPPREVIVKQGYTTAIDCEGDGDPTPTVSWKRGNINNSASDSTDRISQLQNNSLQILVAQPIDSGVYMCVINNSVGGQLKHVRLLVQVDGGWDEWTPWTDCSVTCGYGLQRRSRTCSNPTPTNGGLQCVGAADTSKACLPMDCAVNGGWSDWLPWESCSATCGKAERVRRRYCDNPSPKHGGEPCEGEPMITEPCDVSACPVDGNWTRWSPWQPCTVTCGDGYQERYRYCSEPAPSNGGLQCHGTDTDRRQCNTAMCPVHGGWSGWNSWDTCTVSCGGGQRSRRRTCNNPTPAHGGRRCIGFAEQLDYCNPDLCPSKPIIEVDVNDHQAVLAIFVSVSADVGPHVVEEEEEVAEGSVGGGRFNSTVMDVTVTQNNGEAKAVVVVSTARETVHGGWSNWQDWGECTLPCNGGQRKRFRSCDSPTPSLGGRACIDAAQETGECNSQPCPEGVWASWSSWSTCSVSCGSGERERDRNCLQPLSGSQQCEGESQEVDECITAECRAPAPIVGRGNVLGEVNGVVIEPIALMDVLINPALSGDEATIIMGDISKLLPVIGSRMRLLGSLMASFYWTTAYELGGAANGYSLTDGNFHREAQVEFTTGEIVKLNHVARGVDKDGILQVDIMVSGDIPEFPEESEVTLEPFTEAYIQTGPGKIYGSSSRLFRVDGRLLPYAWNHTILYDSNSYKSMPYLVQRLDVLQPSTDYNPATQSLSFNMKASIEPGHPSDKCPSGFIYDSAGPYCQDTDECSRLSPCSHQCTNTAGGYRCSCPTGLALSSDTKTCQDIDECSVGLARCHRSQECINTEGSYKCLARCSDGYTRTDDGLSCIDINECMESLEPICDQTCVNIRGSYQCKCRFGYRLYGRSRCIDINECQRSSPPCSHACENTPGGYRCLCPDGTRLVGGTCENINECSEGLDTCRADEQCKDLSADEGKFECVMRCPPGMDQTADGKCVDQDECARGTHKCSYNQICNNLNGTYACTCRRGYRTDGPGRPCVDYNECARPGLCQYQCRNTEGSFQCLCPKGFSLHSTGRSCIDRDECTELNIKCGPDQRCFNQRGTYQCIDVSCPKDYVRLPSGGCGLPCAERPDLPCLTGMYVDVVEFHTLAIPSGVPAGQDLLRLTAYNQNHEQLLNTEFTMADNDLNSFVIRVESGKGIVSSILPLQADTTYRIKVRSTSFDDSLSTVQYQTTFIIYISVSEFPF